MSNFHYSTCKLDYFVFEDVIKAFSRSRLNIHEKCKSWENVQYE